LGLKQEIGKFEIASWIPHRRGNSTQDLAEAMLSFQVVILAAAVMLTNYCEFTDTFSPGQQGFTCRDPLSPDQILDLSGTAASRQSSCTRWWGAARSPGESKTK